MLATQSRAVAIPGSVPSPHELTPGWREIVSAAEPFLRAVAGRLTAQVEAFEVEIVPYVAYALEARGKQIRPALVALSAGATGGVNDAHVSAAVIIEMIHLATLVHDDVMDEASLRRGRPTLATRWGNEISVLVGDCLFAHALKLAAAFPTTEICRAVASATNTVCSGEILQTDRRKNFELSRAEYFKVLRMKTGELFALSCDLGAYLNGAAASTRAALRQYGMAVGVAYQLYDDCLDLFGSEQAAGKSLGTDLAKGKMTLPMLILMDRVEASERRRIKEWIANWEPQAIPRVMDLLRAHGVFAEARETVQRHLEAARQELAKVPDSDDRRALYLLTRYLGQQTDALEEAT
ncbi:MAG TPA: polyprenyl synthetase family protein [Methylomirabilota bacterium]|nr:polyprenyl synthetase family protein [Methylomirabilota bacterium]